MKLVALRQQVCDANRRLSTDRQVTLTWGNVSGIDREASVLAIKRSGVLYDRLTAASIFLVDLDGRVVDGDARPSSDTPTHLLLYRHFAAAGGITHIHSRKATAFAQARRSIPCLGTTRADHPIPVDPTRTARTECGSKTC